jgi:predicted metal-dependent hydrolase
MSKSLTVRAPDFQFDAGKIIWSDAPEVSVIFNAMSTSTPVVEKFLNKVMMACRKQVGPESPELREDIDDFVRQESNHYRIHARWNDLVEQAGFHLDPSLEETFDAEFRDMLKNRSLNFLTAYCAGFENFTLFFARYLFEEGGALFKDGDSIGDLWRWHFAEEYEHRKVCHDGFAAISGNYFMRIWGLVYSSWHLNKNIAPRIKSFLEQYRQDMTPAERKASIKREKQFIKAFYGWTLPRMLQIFIPFYNPGNAAPSPGMEKALARYGAMAEAQLA